MFYIFNSLYWISNQITICTYKTAYCSILFRSSIKSSLKLLLSREKKMTFLESGRLLSTQCWNRWKLPGTSLDLVPEKSFIMRRFNLSLLFTFNGFFFSFKLAVQWKKIMAARIYTQKYFLQFFTIFFFSKKH